VPRRQRRHVRLAGEDAETRAGRPDGERAARRPRARLVGAVRDQLLDHAGGRGAVGRQLLALLEALDADIEAENVASVVDCEPQNISRLVDAPETDRGEVAGVLDVLDGAV